MLVWKILWGGDVFMHGNLNALGAAIQWEDLNVIMEELAQVRCVTACGANKDKDPFIVYSKQSFSCGGKKENWQGAWRCF